VTLRIGFAAALLVTLNLVAFAAQGIDKQLAKRGARRIPEKRLLWLGVPLAAPGMWLGMHVFRHKTSKPSFLALAAFVTLVNLALAWGVYEAWDRGWLAFRS
jgi:uncharacterized membrane protein YsdA (DUF1294 family)